jgi:tetratricopeptide (TPR) repeat protein
MAYSHAVILLNRGRPAEAAAWMDTLYSVTPNPNYHWVVAAYFGGELRDTSRLTPDLLDALHAHNGDTAASKRSLAFQRGRAAQDSLQGFWFRMVPVTEAILAVQRHDPAAARLVDVADSLWRGQEGSVEWAAMRIAQLYQEQGRMDRALRAIRRRFSSLGQPKPMGLAESYRIEGRLAAAAGDRAGAIRAYRNYLTMRVDPEPSRIPQRDSVLAELARVADLEGTR